MLEAALLPPFPPSQSECPKYPTTLSLKFQNNQLISTCFLKHSGHRSDLIQQRCRDVKPWMAYVLLFMRMGSDNVSELRPLTNLLFVAIIYEYAEPMCLLCGVVVSKL
jgi:hypothetical protein